MKQVCLLALLLSACGVTQVLDRTSDGLPILVRTPQPDAEDLSELHAEFGVRTVLNLRGESPRSWFQEEREGVAAIGAKWVHLKVSGTKGPTPEQIQQFMDLVEDPSNWPILLHCQGGIHRTGVMSGLYRVQYQGWSGDAAVDEMEDHWFDWTTRDRAELKRFLRGYQPDPQRAIDRGEER